MHEWGLVADAIEEIKNHSAKNNITKVIKIQIGLGKKSDVSERVFKTCFKVLAKDTIMEKAKLSFTKKADHIITVDAIQGSSCS
jgi:hydrogenase nickel incorporation protein HypA/HybF